MISRGWALALQSPALGTPLLDETLSAKEVAMQRAFFLASDVSLTILLSALLRVGFLGAESFQTIEQHESVTRPVAIAVADFDGDGLDDAVVVHEGSASDPATARVLLAAGSGGALALEPAAIRSSRSTDTVPRRRPWRPPAR
jgi:hypothetical protein